MIHAFPKSKWIAWGGGGLFGIIAVIIAWRWIKTRQMGLMNQVLVVGLIAFIAVNVAIYIARIVAMKEYQQKLLLLYRDLDPQAFLKTVEPLKTVRMDAANHCTLLVHVANGYLYAGQPQKALEILSQVQPPEKALEMKGLVASNQATSLLAVGKIDEAQKVIQELKQIVADKNCKKEFVLKARHALGYLQICIDTAKGKHVNMEVLQKDFESCKAPLHQLDVLYQIALVQRRNKDKQGLEKSKNYLRTHSGKTCYAKYADAL